MRITSLAKNQALIQSVILGSYNATCQITDISYEDGAVHPAIPLVFPQSKVIE